MATALPVARPTAPGKSSEPRDDAPVAAADDDFADSRAAGQPDAGVREIPTSPAVVTAPPQAPARSPRDNLARVSSAKPTPQATVAADIPVATDAAQAAPFDDRLIDVGVATTPTSPSSEHRRKVEDAAATTDRTVGPDAVLTIMMPSHPSSMKAVSASQPTPETTVSGQDRVQPSQAAHVSETPAPAITTDAAAPATAHGNMPVDAAPAPGQPISPPAHFQPATDAPAVPSSRPDQHAASEHVTVAAQPGRIGHETGVAIARHAVDGADTVAIRLDPVDMGRIEVRLSFEEGGTLRAVVAADNPASLDLLRRDSVHLIRALSDAGISTDAQSFRFDTRSDDRGGGAWQRPQQAQAYAREDAGETVPETDAPYQRFATRGRVEIMA